MSQTTEHEHIVIRSAKLADIPALAQLNTLGRNEPDGTVGIAYDAADFAACIGRPQAVCLIAEAVSKECSKSVGFILAFDLITWGYIDILCVHPDWRNIGIGSELLEFAEREGTKRGWGYSELCRDETDGSLGRFVEKQDYQDRGTTRWYAKKLKMSWEI